MANIFNSVKIKLQRKNKFNLSFASRLTTEFGRLTPIMCEEVLPNDTFRISSVLKAQFVPMKFPVMQKFTAYIHYFFVPRRLLMTQWEEFITGGDDGISDVHYPVLAWDDAIYDSFTVPELRKIVGSSTLWDYLGFPTFDANPDDMYSDVNPEVCNQFDIMPFKAYQLIYNEWYRDQNLTPEVDIFPDDTGIVNLLHTDTFKQDLQPLFTLRNRAWRKDYFTSALPDPQRGPDVTLPILGKVDMEFKGGDPLLPGTIIRNTLPNDPTFTGGALYHNGATGDGGQYLRGGLEQSASTLEVDNSKNLEGRIVDDEGNPTLRSATINEVRRAFAIQRWYELAARAGNRYIESILAHFGIRSSDARLQRPEYLGGSVIPVNVGDILQTSESGETPLGTPAGVAQALGRSKRIKYTSEEHGFIMGILSIVPEASYPQGMPRKYMRRDKFDFAWPLLANIGEQEIKKSELYFDFTETAGSNNDGFGYAPRYSEYKFGVGQVHGDFRTSLRDFHDARFFNRRPLLNTEFIEVSTNNDGNDGLNRIFAVRSNDMADHIWCNLYNDIVVRRVLPKYGTPV